MYIHSTSCSVKVLVENKCKFEHSSSHGGCELNAEESLSSVWKSFVHRLKVNAKEKRHAHNSKGELLENKTKLHSRSVSATPIFTLKKSLSVIQSVRGVPIRLVSCPFASCSIQSTAYRLQSRVSTSSFLFTFKLSKLSSSQVPK